MGDQSFVAGFVNPISELGCTVLAAMVPLVADVKSERVPTGKERKNLRPDANRIEREREEIVSASICDRANWVAFS
jgi:hypothetical protein